jgi:hypothetical protein
MKDGRHMTVRESVGGGGEYGGDTEKEGGVDGGEEWGKSGLQER